MSKTTSIYANHNLDTSSVINLALDLSKRLKATVIYGYIDDYNDTNPDDVTYDFVPLGKVIDESLKKSYKLIENDYIIKQLPHIDKINYASTDGLPLYEFVTNETDFDNILNIFPEILELNSMGFKSWYSYCDFFLYENSSISKDAFEQWRYQMRRQIYRLGGDSCFITADCSALLNESSSWQETIDDIANKYRDFIVNIPQYFTNEQHINRLFKEYKELSPKFLRKIRYAVLKNISYPKQTDLYPKIFYDDFSDLKYCRTTNKEFIGKEFEQCLKNFKIIDDYSFVENIKIERETLPLIIAQNDFLVLESSITGLMHYGFENIEFELKVNQEVFIKREPDNTFDNNAIEVYCKSNGEELQKLGYIMRWVNETLARYIDNGFNYKAFITKIDDDKIDLGRGYQDAVIIQVYDCSNS